MSVPCNRSARCPRKGSTKPDSIINKRLKSRIKTCSDRLLYETLCADEQSAPQVTNSATKASIKVSSPSAKASIAPLETRGLSVKPPSTGVGQGELQTPPSMSTSETYSAISIPLSTAPVPSAEAAGASELDKTASAYFQWGLAFASQGEYKAARAEFQASLARDPQDLNTWYYLGVCAEALGDIEQAHSAYNYVLQLDPTFVPTTNVGGESTLFLEIKENTAASDSLAEESDGNQNDWVTSSFLAGVLVAVMAILLLGYIARYPNSKLAAFLGIAKTPKRALLSSEKINEMADATMNYFKGDKEVIVELLTIASEIASEGREGKHVGTAFIIGDTEEVLKRSRPLILNPFKGHDEKSRHILDRQTHENIKEVAQMDGAFVIRGDGVVVAAGRYISIDTGEVRVPKGLGTRHVSTGAITKATHAIGIVVSESGGGIRVFANGEIIASNVSE